MRLRIVSERIEIPKLDPNERMVHLAFRASNVDFLSIMQRCPRLRMIQVSPHYRKALSNALQVFLEMQGIALLEGDVYSDGNDLDEYFTVDNVIVDEIHAMAENGMSVDDVAARVKEKAKISLDLVKYIARTKIAI